RGRLRSRTMPALRDACTSGAAGRRGVRSRVERSPVLEHGRSLEIRDGNASLAVTSIVAPKSYRFGAFELQVGERRLLRQGAPVALRPHAFDVLSVMVER